MENDLSDINKNNIEVIIRDPNTYRNLGYNKGELSNQRKKDASFNKWA